MFWPAPRPLANMSVRLPDFKLANAFGFITLIFNYFLYRYADDGSYMPKPLPVLAGKPSGLV